MAKGKKKRVSLSWEEWYLLAAEYYEANGDLLIPREYVCPSGEKLGRWIERQRAKYNHVPSVKGSLDEVQIGYLNRIGMVWKLEYRRSWEEWLEELDRYAETHGDLNVPHSYTRDGYGLGDWLVKQRLSYAAGELTPGQIADLEARGIRWNLRARPRPWEAWFADAEAYYREHGDLLVKQDYVTPAGDRLGEWIYRQRDLYMGRKKGYALSRERIDRLDRIGMVWEPLATRGDAWERMYLWVSAYRDAHQRLPLWPRDIKAPDGRSMCGWIRTQRQRLAEEGLPPERAERLAALGIHPAKKSAPAQIA